MTNKETNIITVRVNKKIKDEIESIANQEKINLSTVLNKILTEHVEWNRFRNELQFITLNSEIVKEIFNSLDEKKLQNIANIGIKTFENICEHIQGEINFESFIATLDRWFNNSNFNFRHITMGDSDKYFIIHNNGINFSKFILGIVSSNIEKFERKLTNTKVEANRILFTIEKV